MINFKTVKNYCNESLSLIENYDKAISDPNKMWHCHHRRENISSRKELIKKNEYYNLPASELIFLTHSEHSALHMLGKPRSEETRKKISTALKGNKIWIGKHHSEESREKMSKSRKGLCWFNNGIIAVRAKSCPEGFVKGRLKRKTQITV